MNTTNNNATKSDKSQEGKPMTGKLVLVRHAESEWNALGKWTGHTDVHISKEGQRQAAKMGELIKDMELHHGYSSELIRTVETFVRVVQNAGKANLPHKKSAALNERDYGEYTGLNKWEVLEQVGKEKFASIRRGWEHPIPGGETAKMVYERAVPFYNEHIVPKLLAGQNILIVSHGNTLRALIKYLEDISDEGIAEVEMPLGTVIIYDVNELGKSSGKEVRKIEIGETKA